MNAAGPSPGRRVVVSEFGETPLEAIEKFATLEPMSPPDRKVVHDTVSAISGVETSSEGLDADRHVVIRRSAAAAPQDEDTAAEPE